MNQKIQAAVKEETNRKPAAGLENDKKIIVLAARVINLKNIDEEIPRNSPIVITCHLYTLLSHRDGLLSRMPPSA